MRAYIDIELFSTPKEFGGKNGARKVSVVGKAIGNEGRPRIIVGQNGQSVAVRSTTTYVPVYNEAGEHIGDMGVSFGSLLAPKASTVEVVS